MAEKDLSHPSTETSFPARVRVGHLFYKGEVTLSNCSLPLGHTVRRWVAWFNSDEAKGLPGLDIRWLDHHATEQLLRDTFEAKGINLI